VARDLFVAVLAIDPNNEKALEGRRYTRRMLMQQRRALLTMSRKSQRTLLLWVLAFHFVGGL